MFGNQDVSRLFSLRGADMTTDGADRNIRLYPWFKFAQNLIFWQAIWFLFFQNTLSAAEAVMLYAIYDLATTALEVPSGYLSDRLGRRLTLTVSAAFGAVACGLIALGSGFVIFAAAQICLGASAAFASGTDSALLYESLEASGRADQIEAEELRAWRFTFAALAISAASGGLLAMWVPVLPFIGGALAFAAALIIALRFAEPDHEPESGAAAHVPVFAALRRAFAHPVLIWLFVISLLMYSFSHIPYVFGQPFINEALEARGLQQDAPLVSGIVSSVMMIISVIASVYAGRLRDRIGLAPIVLLAFAMQIALAGVLAMTNTLIAIGFLFLRMVPDSISRPFVIARIQPLLSDTVRATYLSLMSFFGRLLFSGSLFLAAAVIPGDGAMAYADLRWVLAAYTGAGLICLTLLALAARRIKIDGS